MTELVPLNEVFTVAHGSKMDLNKMIVRGPGSEAIAFIGRSGEGNGLTAFVGSVLGVEPYPAGLITVALGGSALASFVQPRRFYTAQNVDVLTPMTPMSLETKIFYCLCIEANRFRYSTFGREANRTLRTVPVPAVESLPGWIEGASEEALADLCSDLSGLIRGAEDNEDADDLANPEADTFADLTGNLLKIPKG